MSQKYKSIIAVIIFIWSFAIGFVLGEDKGITDTKATAVVQQDNNSGNNGGQQAQPPVKPDTDSNTGNSANNGTADSGTDNSANNGTVNDGTNNGTANNGTNTTPDNSTNNGTAAKDPTQYTDEEVIQWINYYVNLVKSEQNMTAKKTESIKVKVLDCSIPSLTGTVNNIVDGLVGDGGESVSYTITNGAVASTDDPEASTSDTPFSLIPPTNKQFVVSKEGIVDAKAEVDANGNVTYTVVLVAEDTTLTSPEPFYNATAIGYLNLAGLDIPIAKINKADMHYPGSTVSVTVDANDKVIKLYNKLPMSGSGEASIGWATGTADFEGSLDETWEFTY